MPNLVHSILVMQPYINMSPRVFHTQVCSCAHIGQAADLLPSSHNLFVWSHNGRAYAIEIYVTERQSVAGNYMERIYRKLISRIEQRIYFMTFMRKRF